MFLASAVLVINGIRLFSRRWESSGPADFKIRENAGVGRVVQDFGLSSLLCGHAENQGAAGPG